MAKTQMNDNLFDVSDEIVIVTGVSGQLGAEYAKILAQGGASVIGLDITVSTQTKKLLDLYPKNFHFVEADVTKKLSLIGAKNFIVKEIGSPTVLINNAAIDSSPSSPASENGPFEEYPESSWDTVLDVNLKGTYLCCQVFGAVMSRKSKGSIINVASIYGMVAPDQSLYEYRRKRGDSFFKPVAYTASKSGIMNLTRYLAVYWAKKNVRVNSLVIAGVKNEQDKEFISNYTKRIPIGRMAEVNEYNGAVLFLASHASNYMTGHSLVVDGGWTAI